MDQRPSGMFFVSTADAGRMVGSDDALLGATLTFAGTYVSDDGRMMITTVSGGAASSGARFVGYCDMCPPDGPTFQDSEPLDDVSAAVLYAAAHRHGDEE